VNTQRTERGKLIKRCVSKAATGRGVANYTYFEALAILPTDEVTNMAEHTTNR
jgi:hypothetical protein